MTSTDAATRGSAHGNFLLGCLGWLFLQLDAIFYGIGGLLAVGAASAVVLFALKLLILAIVFVVRSTLTDRSRSKSVPILFCIVTLSAAMNFLRYGDGDPSERYVIYALTLALPAVAVGMCLFDRDLQRAASFGTGVSVVSLALFLLAYDGATAEDRGYLNDVGGASHLLIGQSVVIILVLSSSEWVRQRRVLLNALLVVAGVFLLFVSGSRGSMVAGVLAVAFYLTVSLVAPRQGGFGKLAARSVLMIGVLLVSAYLVFERLPSDSLARQKFEALLQGGDESTWLRDYWQGLAWRQFLGSPVIGEGVGGFAHHMNSYVYPHNIALELLADFGVFGILVLAFVVFRIVKSGASTDSLLGRSYLVAATAILMFSGSYALFPLFWFALGLTSPSSGQRSRYRPLLSAPPRSGSRDIHLRGRSKAWT